MSVVRSPDNQLRQPLRSCLDQDMAAIHYLGHGSRVDGNPLEDTLFGDHILLKSALWERRVGSSFSRTLRLLLNLV